MANQETNFTAIDSSFSRNRLSVSLAEFCSTTNDCKSRSLWEKQINIQRSEDLKVTVSEWTQGSSDKTWATNTKVKIIFPYLSINSEYLLTGLIFRHSEGLGQESLLEFEDVDSFLI
jgi:prophage tail gpP-like protein